MDSFTYVSGYKVTTATEKHWEGTGLTGKIYVNPPGLVGQQLYLTTDGNLEQNCKNGWFNTIVEAVDAINAREKRIEDDNDPSQ